MVLDGFIHFYPQKGWSFGHCSHGMLPWMPLRAPVGSAAACDWDHHSHVHGCHGATIAAGSPWRSLAFRKWIKNVVTGCWTMLKVWGVLSSHDSTRCISIKPSGRLMWRPMKIFFYICFACLLWSWSWEENFTVWNRWKVKRCPAPGKWVQCTLCEASPRPR